MIWNLWLFLDRTSLWNVFKTFPRPKIWSSSSPEVSVDPTKNHSSIKGNYKLSCFELYFPCCYLILMRVLMLLQRTANCYKGFLSWHTNNFGANTGYSYLSNKDALRLFILGKNSRPYEKWSLFHFDNVRLRCTEIVHLASFWRLIMVSNVTKN